MAKITFKGNEVNTNGTLPAVGAEAPDFKGVKSDLSELSLKELKGKNVVINVFPSLDTAVCAASVRSRFFTQHCGTCRIKRFTFCTWTLLYDGRHR